MPTEPEYLSKFYQGHIRFLYSTFCILCAADSSVDYFVCVCVWICYSYNNLGKVHWKLWREM